MGEWKEMKLNMLVGIEMRKEIVPLESNALSGRKQGIIEEFWVGK